MSDIYYHEAQPQHNWTNWPLSEFCADEDVPTRAIDECIERLDAQWFETDVSNTKESIGTVENDFLRLAEIWRSETENMSSMTKILSHSAYQKIIGLSRLDKPSVVRLILADLRKHRGYWGVALQTITGENPVRPENIGNPNKVREDWLKWGKSHGYVK